ncbi:hypothetical protein [Pelomicrobium methylotrophicum]|uniref:Uncharacterized protein n=1 Tax=Pelomicrobium methylotrophicum TaxID=2602750 RepID=A0A5C7EGT2_9PROT|nr:hypothetical protein [Pelomicrobium methylotrophicum]TXF10500.1 hypothetical protein FR698_14860 [Pelomicrobium methylotrophicum]
MSRISAMVRIVSLKGIARRQRAIIREGKMEAARVWCECRDRHLKARQESTPWPGRNEYHQATKGGRFALHSQTIQQIFRAFDAAVDSARRNRRNGRIRCGSPPGTAHKPRALARSSPASAG